MYLAERLRSQLRGNGTDDVHRCVFSSLGQLISVRFAVETGWLGAPWEYLEYKVMMPTMMARLKATSFPDYMEKLMACRTSGNGVFGLKAHFHQFDHALRAFPRLLDYLPGTQIHLEYISQGQARAGSVPWPRRCRTTPGSTLEPRKHEVPPLLQLRVHQAVLAGSGVSRRELAALVGGALRSFRGGLRGPWLRDQAAVLRTIAELHRLSMWELQVMSICR